MENEVRAPGPRVANFQKLQPYLERLPELPQRQQSWLAYVVVRANTSRSFDSGFMSQFHSAYAPFGELGFTVLDFREAFDNYDQGIDLSSAVPEWVDKTVKWDIGSDVTAVLDPVEQQLLLLMLFEGHHTNLRLRIELAWGRGEPAVLSSADKMLLSSMKALKSFKKLNLGIYVERMLHVVTNMAVPKPKPSRPERLTNPGFGGSPWQRRTSRSRLPDDAGNGTAAGRNAKAKISPPASSHVSASLTPSTMTGSDVSPRNHVLVLTDFETLPDVEPNAGPSTGRNFPEIELTEAQAKLLVDLLKCGAAAAAGGSPSPNVAARAELGDALADCWRQAHLVDLEVDEARILANTLPQFEVLVAAHPDNFEPQTSLAQIVELSRQICEGLSETGQFESVVGSTLDQARRTTNASPTSRSGLLQRPSGISLSGRDGSLGSSNDSRGFTGH